MVTSGRATRGQRDNSRRMLMLLLIHGFLYKLLINFKLLFIYFLKKKIDIINVLGLQTNTYLLFKL